MNFTTPTPDIMYPETGLGIVSIPEPIILLLGMILGMILGLYIALSIILLKED